MTKLLTFGLGVIVGAALRNYPDDVTVGVVLVVSVVVLVWMAFEALR